MAFAASRGFRSAVRRVTWAAASLAAMGGCAALIDADFSDKTLRDGPVEEPPDAAPGGGGGACGDGRPPGPERCETSDVDENCDGAPTCTGEMLLGTGFGAPGDQGYCLVSVGVDGDIFLGVRAEGSVDYGGGPVPPDPPAAGDLNIHLARFTAAGAHVWSKSVGTAQTEDLGSLQVDSSGDLVIAGTSSGELDLGAGPLRSGEGVIVFLAKLDGSGEHVWSKGFGDQLSDATIDMAVFPDRSILLAGDFTGTLNLGGEDLVSRGARDIFIARFTEGGDHVWSKRLGDVANEEVRGVAVNGEGESTISGSFSGEIDLGITRYTPASAEDSFLLKLDPAGDAVWSDHLQGDAPLYAVAMNDRGEVFAAGKFTGPVNLGEGAETLTPDGASDALVLGYDAQGKIAWSQAFGGESIQGVVAVATDGAGNVLIAGDTTGGIKFGIKPRDNAMDPGENAFVAKLDPLGNIVWGRLFDGPGGQASWSVAADPLGNVVAAGVSDGSIDLVGAPIASQGAGDVWLARMRP